MTTHFFSFAISAALYFPSKWYQVKIMCDKYILYFENIGVQVCTQAIGEGSWVKGYALLNIVDISILKYYVPILCLSNYSYTVTILFALPHTHIGENKQLWVCRRICYLFDATFLLTSITRSPLPTIHTSAKYVYTENARHMKLIAVYTILHYKTKCTSDILHSCLLRIYIIYHYLLLV